MAEIPQKRTEVTSAEAVAILAAAYESTMSRRPTPKALAILCAQSALETGRWRSMWNWNWGNIRGSYRGMTQSINGADEIIDGKRVVVEAGFRAYPDAAQGAVDFVRFLGVDTTPNNGRPNRYQRAWDALEAGDPELYSRELKAAGYYTANVERYTRGVVSLMETFLPLCEAHLRPDTIPAPPHPDPDLVADMRRGIDDAERGLALAKQALARMEV